MPGFERKIESGSMKRKDFSTQPLDFLSTTWGVKVIEGQSLAMIGGEPR
jgi:hypothetical protein